MDFRVLGPLEVVDDAGSLVAIGGPKQRALLALLLVNANEVVSSERLLDELWGDEPPGSGMSALHVRVSQLRRILEQLDPAGRDSMVETRPPGYLLRIGDTQLDAWRFERLVAAGTGALARADPVAAASFLDDALAIFRGAPFAGVATIPSIQADATRLDELRMTAVEARVEARFELGQHAALVPDLECLVAQHPVRERLRAQLMRALYRAGRQADALAVFRDGRRMLVDTLGIEPGEDLRQLEAAILRQDAVLAPTRAPAAQPVSALAEVAPERKIVTILLADVTQAVDLAGLDAEQAADALSDLFDAAAALITAVGGTVETASGDVVMATFGAPLAHEDHAERALYAALAVRHRFTELAGGMAPHIGVATGEVIVGRAGRGAPLVAGALVNIGARIQQAAAAGEILVHERTTRAARGAFEFGRPRTVMATDVRPLVRSLSLTRPRRNGGLERVFVGREPELELLRTTYRRVVAGQRPAFVSIVGDAGIGKSALAQMFWEWLSGQAPEPLRRSGSCLSYGLGVTYTPLHELVRDQYGLRATDPSQMVRERLASRPILGLALGLEVDPELHARAAHRQLHDALVSLVQEMVADQAAVLLIEDLHWAEAPLLELLETLVAEVAGPLLVIGTARPEFVTGGPPWAGLRNAATVWLEPLGQADTELQLDELVGDALPGKLRQRLVMRSEGNPFFAEELLADLVDRGVVRHDASGWHTDAHPPDLTISDSIHGVLAARIDLLPPAEKHAVQAASVIGRTFWAGAVAELMLGQAADLAMLERRDFVQHRLRSTISGELEFVFKHALTRDVAYSTLPNARRAQLHAAFAHWLERVGGGRDQDASMLAHHYSRAAVADDEQLRAKALAWLQRAGALAIGRYEIDDGIALLEQAIRLEPSASARSDLWRSVGRAKAINYDAAGMWAAMETAIELADDDATRADICSEVAVQTAFRAGMLINPSTADTAQTWTQRALELAKPGTAARALALSAAVCWRPPDTMTSAATEAAAIADELDDPILRYFAWDACSVAALHAGDDESAWAWLKRRLELLDRISDPDMIADIAATLAGASTATGRFEQAREMAEWHDQITQPLTPHHRIHGVALLVELAEALGQWADICALEYRVRDAVAANVATPCIRNARTLLACALARQILGQPEQARSLEQAAEQIGLPSNERVDTPRIRLALMRNDLQSVEQLLRRHPESERVDAHGIVNARTFVPRLDAFTTLARAARLDALEALGLYDRLLAEAQRLLTPGTYLEPFALRALGRARDDPALIALAINRFERLGLDWHASQTRSAR